jgi:hypothetical protein
VEGSRLALLRVMTAGDDMFAQQEVPEAVVILHILHNKQGQCTPGAT